jgi:hypothetical protein
MPQRQLHEVARALRLRTEARSSKKRKQANDQKDNPTRGITDACHPDQRPARQIPCLNVYSFVLGHY